MANQFPSKRDVVMTLDGDLAVGGNGDFELTEGFDWLAREINKIVRTTNPLWTVHPTIGAGVESYIGRTNDRATANDLRRDIIDAVERSTLLGAGQSVAVDVIPLSLDSVAVYVNISSDGVQLETLKLIVDYRSGVTAQIPDDTFSTPPPPPPRTRKPANKYLRRISESS